MMKEWPSLSHLTGLVLNSWIMNLIQTNNALNIYIYIKLEANT